MWSNLAVDNLSGADVIPMWSAHAVNPSDAFYVILMYHIIQSGMHACQPLTTKNNCFTFLGSNDPKCK